MYENVIVPYDGTLEGRAILGPANDLAWRCGARLVLVSNTDAADKSSKAAVKLQAIAKSGATNEFWVDLEHPLGEAAIKAAAYRTQPIVCVASPRSRNAFSRKRGPSSLIHEIVRDANVPVLALGPAVDATRGLPMTELVVVLDGLPGSEGMVAEAMRWCQAFKLHLVLTGIGGSAGLTGRPEMQAYLDQHADSAASPGGVSVELVRASGVAGVEALLRNHADAVAMVPAGQPGTALDGFAADLLGCSPRALLLHRA